MNFHLKKKYIKAILLFFALFTLFVGAYLLLNAWERFSEMPVSTGSSATGTQTSLEIGGETYALRENLTTLLLIGVDKTGEMKAAKTNINDAQCDFLTLIVFDEDANTYTLLQLNRDTMARVPMLGIGGTVIGHLKMQLALSHTYGDGMEESCENTVTSVENFLYNVPIDHYFAINMSGVSRVVDSVGGVTVTIRDDFSEVDPSLVQGQTMLLNGEQCLTYLRGRRDVGDQTNLSRMERQKEFVREFLNGMKKDDQTVQVEALADAANYMLTDLSGNRLNRLLEEILAADFTEIVSPEGEAVVGEEFMEFYADEASVQELVLRLFCEPAGE